MLFWMRFINISHQSLLPHFPLSKMRKKQSSGEIENILEKYGSEEGTFVKENGLQAA